MVKAVTRVVPLGDYRLLLTFAGGECRVFDVAPYLAIGVFRALQEKPLFDAVRLSFDTIAWPNGADFCPEMLYSESQPIAPDELSGIGMATSDASCVPSDRSQAGAPRADILV